MSWLKLDTDVHKIFGCKVSFKCCCQVDSWLLIKNFEHRCDQVLSGKKHNNDGSRFYLIALLYVVSKQKKKKWKHRMPRHIHTIQKSSQLKTREFHLPPACSHSEVFCKKGVLRNFAKFTAKHLCQSLFF